MPVLFFMITLAPPDPQQRARYNDDAWQKNQAQPEKLALLRFRQDHAAIGGALGTDGDQILILRQPVDGVQKKIAVALQPRPLVCREARIPYDHQARVLGLTGGAARHIRLALGGYAQ